MQILIGVLGWIALICLTAVPVILFTLFFMSVYEDIKAWNKRAK